MSDAAAQPIAKTMDNIMALCKRRGFIYQASEIYGGINGFWDYGPLGSVLKKHLRDAWWEDVVMMPCWGRKGPNAEPVSTVAVDTCIIQHPKVWQASGHIAGFNDPMVDDKETKQRFRADHLFGASMLPQELAEAESPVIEMERAGQATTVVHPFVTYIASTLGEALAMVQSDKRLNKEFRLGEFEQGPPTDPNSLFCFADRKDGKRFIARLAAVEKEQLQSFNDKIPSPFSGKAGSLTPPRQFNLMFKTYVGATASEDDVAYLRPETAQGIFVQFKNVVDTTRVRVPFGIAQTGKAFRNEVTPRNFTFRSREFEQMEIEFFCHESEAMAWYRFWRDWRMEWWKGLGLAGDNLILREHEKDELSHYSQGTSDVEYRFPFTAPGFGELEGIAYRGNYDLTQHQEHSKVKLDYFDTDRGELLPNGSKKGERYIPHVIEPSAGLDRGVLALICEAFTPDATRASGVYMKFHPRVAPIKAAVFPLVNKDGMPDIAEKLHADLVRRFGRFGAIETDAKQSIGKRYARMDEAGCPFCFTIDGDTAKDQSVTVRHRDTQAQERLPLDKVVAFLSEKLGM